MRKIDVTTPGVEELQPNMAVAINGGVVPFLIGLIAGAIISEICDRNSKSDYQDGWNDAQNGTFNPYH